MAKLSETLKTDYIHVLPNPSATIHYVSLSGGNVWPYHTWEYAATNIQDAVYAASDGDTVLVTNGTYYLDSEISVTNNIIVESVNGPESTIVDGNKAGRCFYLEFLPTIAGFTITNGRNVGGDGGGVNIGSGGTITNCIVNGNYAYFGGGIICKSGNAMVINCTISGNTAAFYGGGVFDTNAYAVIQNCTISDNRAGDGAGIYGGDLVKNCTLIANSAGDAGGGIYADGVVENCIIKTNRATQKGGGVFGDAGSIIQNSIIINNHSGNIGGGGIYCYNGTIQNCTISGNGGISPAGVKCTGDATVQNCIIFGNSPGEMDIPATNRYNCIRDWPLFAGGINIITNNPHFVSDSDFHLLGFSDCIDAGTNLPYVYTTTDLDGNPRLDGPTVDMGCYEFIPEPGALAAVISCLFLILGIWRNFYSKN